MKKSADQLIVSAIEAIPFLTDSVLDFPPLSCQLQLSNLTCLVGPHRDQLRAYLLMLAGVSKPEQGTVEVLGKQMSMLDPQSWQQLRSQVGYLSGVAPLLSTQQALMNVMLPVLYHSDLSYQAVVDKATALLAELGCQFEATMYPAMLNSFQRAQLALARALMLDPQLLIMDLPFNELGANDRHKMADLLGKYKHNRAVCMIGGLQYPHFLEQYADQIVFISEQKIIYFSSWGALMQSNDKEVLALLNVF